MPFYLICQNFEIKIQAGIVRVLLQDRQMDEELNEFEVVWANNSHLNRQKAFSQCLQACKQVQEFLVRTFQESIIRKISQLSKQEYNMQVYNQIFTVQFQRNQTCEFERFIDKISNEYQLNKHIIFGDTAPQKVTVIYLDKSQVRQIVLNMYLFLQDNAEYDMVVFVVKCMTDLDEFNMYCFEKGLKSKKMVAIIGSHHQFQNKLQNNLQHFDKFHFKYYNSKELFCQYVYGCLNNPIIKPYLPFQVLNLIQDMDYYTISYHQSCRRFMYCVERALFIYPKERTFVDFHPLIQIIDAAILRSFKEYSGATKCIPKEKLLKIILSQREQLFLSQKDLILQVVMRIQIKENKQVEEGDIIHCMAEYLKEGLRKNAKFKKYAEYLQDKAEGKEAKSQKKKKTKSRQEQLGIDSLSNLTPKAKLQRRITKIIKDATALIRQQASNIKWSDLQYQLRIKPQIPYIIKQAWHSNNQTIEVVQQILQNYSAAITTYLKPFKENDSLGQGIYQLKCLQYVGLISIGSRQLKPIVYTHYFDKAEFTRKNM